MSVSTRLQHGSTWLFSISPGDRTWFFSSVLTPSMFQAGRRRDVTVGLPLIGPYRQVLAVDPLGSNILHRVLVHVDPAGVELNQCSGVLKSLFRADPRAPEHHCSYRSGRSQEDG